MTYANGTFVAVGERGAVLTSADAVDWKVGTTGSETDLLGVAFGNNSFVAVGGMSVYVSSDGMHWVERDPGSNDGLQAVAYGNGVFLAVGGGWLSRKNIAVSSNLIDWSIGSSRTARPLRAIAFGNGQFRVVGDEGEGATTFSGSGWISGGVGDAYNLLAVAFGHGAFLDVGQGGYLNFGQKPIGQFAPTTNDLNGVVFANGRFVAVGMRGTIITSTNGLNWSNTISGINTALRAVTFGGGLFVGVGDGGRIVTSADAVYWNVRSTGAVDNLHDLTEGNGRFVAVGDSGAVLVSTNGIQWAAQYIPTGADCSKICSGNGVFVALSSSKGQLFTSSDAAVWSHVNIGSETNWEGIAWGNDRFVVVGWASLETTPVPVALSSTNGYTWVPEDVGTNGCLAAVAYGAGVFVAVGGQWGSERLIVSSTDGKSWTIRDRSAAPLVRTVAYGNSRFVAVDDSGGVLISADGISWQSTGEFTPDIPRSLAYCNCVFLGSGYGTLFSSQDGIHWISHTSPTPKNPYPSVAAGRDSFFMVGAHGQIFQTDPIVTLGLHVGTQPELSIFGRVGRHHLIQATGSPDVLNSWQNAGSILLTNTPQIWQDTRSPLPRQFYRAVLEP